MRNLILFCLPLLLNGCVREAKMYSTQYVIKNETSQVVKLNYYTTLNNTLLNNYIINVNEILEGSLTERGDVPPINYPDYTLAVTNLSDGDSLVVIFNNEKKTIMQTSLDGYSEPLNRNLFRHGNYEYLGNDQFQFTFTEEDYENAEDCGGPCE